MRACARCHCRLCLCNIYQIPSTATAEGTTHSFHVVKCEKLKILNLRAMTAAVSDIK